MFQQLPLLEKLSEFVGRETILKDVGSWLHEGNFHSAFISGDYGIGKSRLLRRILDLASRELKYDGMPTRLIDLYHFRHHSPEGLARAIVACFEKTDKEGYFEFYYRAHAKLESARAAGDSEAIREQLQILLDSCVKGLKKMSAERGILLLFDTVEQIVYPGSDRFAPAWDWVKVWINELPRGAVLFAGRPAATVLFQNISHTTIPLDFFTLEESRTYILTTGENVKGKLFSMDDTDIQRLHVLSQGRPILLALFLELRVRSKLQEFEDLSQFQPESFEQKIIDYLLSQAELGETLKAAGRVPKGINAELLAKIRGISLRESKQALKTLQDMTFAKEFPDDDRVYLHDEIYTLLERYTYSDVSDIADGQAAAQAIYEYYKQAIKQKDEELKNIFESLTGEVDFKQPADVSKNYIPKIRESEIYRQELKTEYLYYRLRHQIGKEKRKAHQDDPIQAGLKNYYRFGHEAAASYNDEILIPLQIELTNFWFSLKDDNFWKPFIGGLLLVHEIWLKVATGQPYLDDIPIHEKNLATIPNLSTDQKTILHTLLETWLGYGLVFAKNPDYDRAEQLFTQSIDVIQNLSVNQPLQWFKDVAISLVHRQRAYMRRIRGAFRDAIDDFLVGLRYSRAMDYYQEESTLRNDLGFAQMQNGLFQPAFENIWDGLQLRYKTAIGPRIALSYSTLAQYYIAKGTYEEARKYARHSIQVSEAVGFRRGLAFGNLAFAEAARRFAFSAQGPSNQEEYLQEAKDAVEIAVQLLEQLGEKARIIESKLEEACLYRDRVRIEKEPFKKKAWIERSNTQFLAVANDAERAGISYRQVDAMCNRIWLGYYAGELEYAKEAMRDFEILEVIKPYWLRNGKFVDEARAKKNPILWSQIGKYYMGQGVIALDAWKNKMDDSLLEDAARYMMLSMTYSTQFATDHRGLREGRHTIYQALASLNPEELGQFCIYVLNSEKIEKLNQRPSPLQNLMKDHALWFAN